MIVLSELQMGQRFNKFSHLLKPLKRIKCPYYEKQVILYEHKFFVSLGTNHQEFYLKLYLFTLLDLIHHKTTQDKNEQYEN